MQGYPRMATADGYSGYVRPREVVTVDSYAVGVLWRGATVNGHAAVVP